MMTINFNASIDFFPFGAMITATTPLPLPVRSAPCEGLLVSGARKFDLLLHGRSNEPQTSP